LDIVIEDCVNAVGVDVNTASAPLLSRVSGLGPTMAQRIVAHREKNGAFASRSALRDVAQFGARTFELAAGFLRVPDGDNPLDASAVHPEAYPVVERILERIGRPVGEVIGQGGVLRGLEPAAFADERFGEPTVRDILAELEKPGRDPRGEFTSASFADGIEKISDLRPGMRLQGVVTNVANFGAFVDIGVHQDGLVHISQLADRFIKDPREAVRAGQVVKVTVLEVDVARKRIALSMKSGARPEAGSNDGAPAPGGGRRPARDGRPGRTGGRDGRDGRGGPGGSGGGRQRDDARRREPATETALGAALGAALAGGRPRRG
ncbi:MAG: helix-hairpin-helix domain-containing protein, partial [Burkholderiaceae bacterium]